ncbi:MAG: cytochrome c5 [Gammaproteobacteria bacterium]
MSNADDIFWRRFGMMLVVLTLFGFVVAFIARDIAGDAHHASMNNATAVAARIAPIGQARVGDPSKVVAAVPKQAMANETMATAATGPVTGEQIYNTACLACHGTGVAGAPKKGDAAAWAPRIALGAEALVKSVLNGKGAMPPKAGNPNLSEEQVRSAVQYLIGGEAASSAAAPAVAAAKQAVKEAMQKAKSMATEAANTATAAASTATSTATAALSSAIAAAPAATKAPTASAAAGKAGNDVYNSGCVACHATGAANAPKLSDKVAWEPRAASGFAALLQSATKGKGAMPPRGGLMSLSDADIGNAIRYMLKEAGVEAAP